MRRIGTGTGDTASPTAAAAAAIGPAGDDTVEPPHAVAYRARATSAERRRDMTTGRDGDAGEGTTTLLRRDSWGLDYSIVSVGTG